MENVRLEEMTWQDCKAALEENDLVILPIGAVEQHGPHLPLSVILLVKSRKVLLLHASFLSLLLLSHGRKICGQE